MVTEQVEPAPDSTEAWVRALWQRYGRAIRATAYRVLFDMDAAEDIVQETLVKAWQHREQLDDPSRGSPAKWLETTARNTAISQLRRRRARVEEVPATPATELVRPQSDHAGRVSDQLLVRDALARLPIEHRRVIELLYFEDRRVQAVADELGIPAGTVKSRAFHALKKLERIIADREEAAPS